jgi:hypothetical protein
VLSGAEAYFVARISRETRRGALEAQLEWVVILLEMLWRFSGDAENLNVW